MCAATVAGMADTNTAEHYFFILPEFYLALLAPEINAVTLAVLVVTYTQEQHIRASWYGTLRSRHQE